MKLSEKQINELTQYEEDKTEVDKVEELKRQLEIIQDGKVEDIHYSFNVIQMSYQYASPRIAEKRCAPSQINKMKRYIKATLRLPYDKEAEVKAHMQGLLISFPKENSSMLSLSECIKETYKSCNYGEEKVCIGFDLMKKPVYLDFADPKTNNLLIGGTNGSGKSTFMHTLIISELLNHDKDGVEIYAFDQKMVEFSFYEQISNVHRFIDEKSFPIELEKVVIELNRRMELLAENRCMNIKDYNKLNNGDFLPRIFVFIDEYAQTKTHLKDTKFEELVADIAARGRAAGISTIVATQNPTVKTVDSDLKRNLQTGICFRVQSYHASKVVIDEKGGETLVGDGEAFFKDNMGLTRMMTPNTSADVESLCALLRTEK